VDATHPVEERVQNAPRHKAVGDEDGSDRRSRGFADAGDEALPQDDERSEDRQSDEPQPRDIDDMELPLAPVLLFGAFAQVGVEDVCRRVRDARRIPEPNMYRLGWPLDVC
jgi:hypothetical protein